ncbi:MAG: hypothetical protein HYX99_04490 [Chloroflexi bacterium]|nr:hypothetical protein [Chloroflexota bacterium]
MPRLALLGLFLLAAGLACRPSGPPPLPKVGQWVRGESLALRVLNKGASPTVVYFQDNQYWQISSPSDQEFLLLEVEIYQNEAGVMQLNPLSRRIELSDSQGNKYTPASIVGGTRLDALPQGYFFAPMFVEPVALPPGNSIKGWIAFLVPKGVSPKDFVWDEIDRITVRL